MARRRHPAIDENHLGPFSKLKTGAPHSLIPAESNFQPGYSLDLGPAEAVEVFDEKGSPVKSGPAPRRLSSPAAWLKTDSVWVGLRFFGNGSTDPKVELIEKEDGQRTLVVRAPSKSLPLNRPEKAVFCGFALEVHSRKPSTDCFVDSLPKVDALEQRPEGWVVHTSFSNVQRSTLEIDAAPPLFYTCGTTGVTPNQFYFQPWLS